MFRSSRALAIAAPLAVMGLIFALSSLRLPVRAPRVPHLDKLAHACEYAVLGGLLVRAIVVGLRRAAAWWPIAALVALLYGFTDEWHQRFVPGRHSTWADVAADGVGSVMGAFAASRLLRGPTSARADRRG